MSTQLTGRVALVTGGTRGIGRGIATCLATAGASVAVTGRNAEDAQIVATEIAEASGCEVVGIGVNVADKSQCEDMVTQTLGRFGRLDILCANAGVFPSARLEEMSTDDLDLVIDVNLKGTVYTVQAALASLSNSDQGRVILTSSITGPITGFPGWAHYAASKAGQLGFMRTAAIELASHGITVNAVLPGNIYTEGLAELGQEYIDTMAASIPLKRLGTVEDIGNTVVFLASGAASYLTGQSIVVDGGQILPETLEALA
ncbi:3-oxoacyl-ACP reductase FabG [soil metagenome]